jgi:molybdopterin converting factor small subunit
MRWVCRGTVNVRVHAIFPLIEAFGQREVDLCLSEGATVKDLLSLIAAVWGGKRTRHLFQQGTGALFAGTNITVNGQAVKLLEGADMKLKDGDEVLVQPPG